MDYFHRQKYDKYVDVLLIDLIILTFVGVSIFLY